MEEKYRIDSRILNLFGKYFETFDYDGKVGRAKNIEMELFLKPNILPPTTKMIKYD